MTPEEQARIEAHNAVIPPAMRFAERIHDGQRYGEGSYMGHVVAAWHIAAHHFPDDLTIQVATILHDTLETKPEAETELRVLFGEEVADIVLAVTPGPGKNRRERNAVMGPRLLALPVPARGVAVKLSDRKANVEHSWQTRDAGHFVMYRKEHPEFDTVLRDALRSGPPIDPKLKAAVKLLRIEVDKLLGWSWEELARAQRERRERFGAPANREEELRERLNAAIGRLAYRQEENARLRVALTQAGIPIPEMPEAPTEPTESP